MAQGFQAQTSSVTSQERQKVSIDRKDPPASKTPETLKP